MSKELKREREAREKLNPSSSNEKLNALKMENGSASNGDHTNGKHENGSAESGIGEKELIEKLKKVGIFFIIKMLNRKISEKIELLSLKNFSFATQIRRLFFSKRHFYLKYLFS